MNWRRTTRRRRRRRRRRRTVEEESESGGRSLRQFGSSHSPRAQNGLCSFGATPLSLSMMSLGHATGGHCKQFCTSTSELVKALNQRELHAQSLPHLLCSCSSMRSLWKVDRLARSCV